MSLRTLKWQNTKVVSRRGKNPSLCFSREASTNSDSESSPVLSHLKEHVNPRKQGLPCGLKNLINSCYLNCTLQVLLYTPFLASFCLANGHSSSCKSSSRKVSCFACVFENTLKSLSTTSAPSATPKDLHSLLTKTKFKRNRQEDAHECFMHVINKYHDALSSKEHKSDDPQPSKSSIIQDLFGGQLCSTLRCPRCNFTSTQFQDSLDLCLDASEATSLYLSLNHFTKAETLEAKSHCINCDSLVRKEVSLSIQKASNVLIVQLKRFTPKGKITKKIPFREEMSLGHCMSKTSREKNPSYELYGVICHEGKTQDYGHYVNFVKNSEGEWFRCSDQKVTEAAWSEVSNAEAYLLLYKKKSFPQSPEVKRQKRMALLASISKLDMTEAEEKTRDEVTSSVEIIDEDLFRENIYQRAKRRRTNYTVKEVKEGKTPIESPENPGPTLLPLEKQQTGETAKPAYAPITPTQLKEQGAGDNNNPRKRQQRACAAQAIKKIRTCLFE